MYKEDQCKNGRSALSEFETEFDVSCLRLIQSLHFPKITCMIELCQVYSKILVVNGVPGNISTPSITTFDCVYIDG